MVVGGGGLGSEVAVRVLDIRSKGPLFQTHWRHGVVSLSIADFRAKCLLKQSLHHVIGYM